MQRCGRSEYFPYMVEGNRVVLPTGRNLRGNQGVTFDTMGVVYVIFCTRGSFYIGKFIRIVRRFLQDHIFEIATYHLKLPLSVMYVYNITETQNV